MQTQTITSNNASVHIKVAYENEFRRFLLTPVTFEKLETMLKTLFNLDRDFRIKFQDDENDWVLLTTDQELVYATELSGSPLRLQVKLLETSVPAHCGMKARGGKACRGQRGGKRGGCKSPEERLAFKSSRLAERITQLESKLASKELSEDREKFLRARLALVTKKLDCVTQKQSEIAQSTTENVPTSPSEMAHSEPVAAEESGPEEEEQKPWKGRRGFGPGRGRGGCRRAMMAEDGTDRPVKCGRKPRIAPELIANFRQCKADLRAARESGDAEKIKACLEAFQAAKDAKWEAKDALKSESL